MKKPVEEIVLQFLIDKNKSCKTNTVSMSITDVKSLEIPEDKIVKSLYSLSNDGCIAIKSKSVHNDFSRFWDLELTSKGIHYFENKSVIRKEKINKQFQFWLPVIISIIALLKSFDKEIILLWKLIEQLLK